MDDVAQLRAELDRAGRAKDLLGNVLLKESFEAIEKELFEGLMALSVDDTVRREKLHMMLVYGRRWRNLLTTMVETGKLAEMQLDEKRRFKLWSR